MSVTPTGTSGYQTGYVPLPAEAPVDRLGQRPENPDLIGRSRSAGERAIFKESPMPVLATHTSGNQPGYAPLPAEAHMDHLEQPPKNPDLIGRSRSAGERALFKDSPMPVPPATHTSGDRPGYAPLSAEASVDRLRQQPESPAEVGRSSAENRTISKETPMSVPAAHTVTQNIPASHPGSSLPAEAPAPHLEQPTKGPSLIERICSAGDQALFDIYAFFNPTTYRPQRIFLDLEPPQEPFEKQPPILYVNARARIATMPPEDTLGV